MKILSRRAKRVNPQFPLAEAGLTVAQIGQALEQLAEQVQPGAHRCAACLSWTEEGLAGAFIHGGITHALTFCPKCFALAAAGRPTANMTANLTAYVREEVQL